MSPCLAYRQAGSAINGNEEGGGQLLMRWLSETINISREAFNTVLRPLLLIKWMQILVDSCCYYYKSLTSPMQWRWGVFFVCFFHCLHGGPMD